MRTTLDALWMALHQRGPGAVEYLDSFDGARLHGGSTTERPPSSNARPSRQQCAQRPSPNRCTMGILTRSPLKSGPLTAPEHGLPETPPAVSSDNEMWRALEKATVAINA
jgi:hypothetical protein